MSLSNRELAFSAEGTQVLEALNKVQALNKSIECLDTERRTFLLAQKEEVYVVGMTTDSFAMSAVVGAEVNTDGLIQVDADGLTSMLRGRKQATFKGTETELVIRSSQGSKYEAKLIFEVDDLDVSEERIAKTLKASKSSEVFESNVIAAIRDGVKRTEIKPFYSDDVILAHITVTNKQVRVACADNFHIAMYQKRVKSKRTLRMAIPAKMFGLIDKFIGDAEQVQFSSDERNLRVTGIGFIVVAPAAQVDQSAFDIVPNYLKSLDSPTFSMEVPDGIRAISANLAALTGDDNKLQIQVKTDLCRLSMRGRAGSVTETIKVKTTGKTHEALVDPRIFEALMNKTSSSKMPIEFHTGESGTSGGFKIDTSPGVDERLVLVGTFYNE